MNLAPLMRDESMKRSMPPQRKKAGDMDTINEVNRPSISALLDSIEDDADYNLYTNRKPPKPENNQMNVEELELTGNEGDDHEDNIFRDFMAEAGQQPQQEDEL